LACYPSRPATRQRASRSTFREISTKKGGEEPELKASRSTFREISTKKGGEEPELNILVLLADVVLGNPQLNKEEENNV
jgi:hypothetical protein